MKSSKRLADHESLAFLESRAMSMYKGRDFRFGVVQATLVSAYGGARNMHMSRARLVSMSDVAVMALVSEGGSDGLSSVVQGIAHKNERHGYELLIAVGFGNAEAVACMWIVDHDCGRSVLRE